MRPETRLIVQAVRSTFDSEDHPLYNLDDDELVPVLFVAQRKHAAYSRGMRLTIEGCELLRKCFLSYDIDLKEEWKWPDLVFLDRRCEYPYFLKPRQVTFFDRGWAVRLRLNGTIEKLRIAMA